MTSSGFSENPQANMSPRSEHNRSARVRLKIDEAGRVVIPAEIRWPRWSTGRH